MPRTTNSDGAYDQATRRAAADLDYAMQPLLDMTDADDALVSSVLDAKDLRLSEVDRCYRDEFQRDLRGDLATYFSTERGLAALGKVDDRRRRELGGRWLKAAVDKVIDRRDRPVSVLDLRTIHKPTFNNEVTPIVDGEVASAHLFPDLRNAKSSIHILNLELEPGIVSDKLIDMLIAKHDSGVTVRVMTDAMGARQMFRGHAALVRRLRNAGIEVLVNKTIPNGLEHRKLFVIDGETAYMGGWCFRDQSVYSKAELQRRMASGPELGPTGCLPAHGDEPAEYHDFMLKFRGDAVRQLQTEFCLGWRYQGGELDAAMNPKDFKATYFPTTAKAPGTSAVDVVQSVPGVINQVTTAMLDVMKRAEHTLDVEVAYLQRDDVVDVLCDKARAGVQVRLLVPGEPDNESYWQCLKNFYPRMLEAGVQIWHFNGYNHGKVALADKRHVWIGTSNPEVVFSAPRWRVSNAFDTGVVVDDPKVGADVHQTICERDFREPTATRVTEMPPESWWGRTKRFVFSTFYGML